VNFTNTRSSESAAIITAKDLLTDAKVAKNHTFLQTQTMSLGTLKKFGGMMDYDDDDENETSPALQYTRNQSRFQFAHSVDPVKKGDSAYNFGFGCSPNHIEQLDRNEILVPMKVQELIHRSIRTLSNSISNRSPEE